MHRSKQTGRRAVYALAALVLVTGAALFASRPAAPAQQEALLRSAPSELAIPADPQQLGAWCAARKAQGTAGLTSRARAWLNDCITLFGGPVPSPSATQSPSPSPSTSASPSPTVSPTATTPPATTPPPSPSPTVGTGCLQRLAECGFPHAGNTGPSGALTVSTGNVSLDNDGQVLADTEVRGCVEVHGTGVLIRNVRIVGDCFYAVRNFATGLVIEDSELSCGAINGTAVVDSNFTARRLDIHNCENGFSVTSNVLVEDTWVHDMEIDGGAHTDGAQINRGATNLTFRHNAMIVPTPGATSAIISWDESAGPQQQQVVIADNLLSGGTYVLYCPRYDTSDTRVTGNRFADPEYGYSNACTGTHVSAWSGNVDDATGAVLAAT